MPVDAIVRVSFQTNVPANQAVNNALVGHPTKATGTGPFQRVGTAAYACSNAPENPVLGALAAVSQALQQHAAVLDFFSVSFVRRT